MSSSECLKSAALHLYRDKDVITTSGRTEVINGMLKCPYTDEKSGPEYMPVKVKISKSKDEAMQIRKEYKTLTFLAQRIPGYFVHPIALVAKSDCAVLAGPDYSPAEAPHVVALAMEIGVETLDAYMKRQYSVLTFTDKNVILQRVVEIVQVAHRNRLVLMDLKPPNVMSFPPEGHDLTRSKLEGGSDSVMRGVGYVWKGIDLDGFLPHGVSLKRAFKATKSYQAPELYTRCFDSMTADYAIDIWTVGVMTFQIFYERINFSPGLNLWKLLGHTELDLMEIMTSEQEKTVLQRTLTALINTSFRGDGFRTLRGFLSNALKIDPKQRATIGVLAQHEFLLCNSRPDAASEAERTAGSAISRASTLYQSLHLMHPELCTAVQQAVAGVRRIVGSHANILNEILCGKRKVPCLPFLVPFQNENNSLLGKMWQVATSTVIVGKKMRLFFLCPVTLQMAPSGRPWPTQRQASSTFCSLPLPSEGYVFTCNTEWVAAVTPLLSLTLSILVAAIIRQGGTVSVPTGSRLLKRLRDSEHNLQFIGRCAAELHRYVTSGPSQRLKDAARSVYTDVQDSQLGNYPDFNTDPPAASGVGGDNSSSGGGGSGGGSGCGGCGVSGVSGVSGISGDGSRVDVSACATVVNANNKSVVDASHPSPQPHTPDSAVSQTPSAEKEDPVSSCRPNEEHDLQRATSTHQYEQRLKQFLALHQEQHFYYQDSKLERAYDELFATCAALEKAPRPTPRRWALQCTGLVYAQSIAHLLSASDGGGLATSSANTTESGDVAETDKVETEVGVEVEEGSAEATDTTNTMEVSTTAPVEVDTQSKPNVRSVAPPTHAAVKSHSAEAAVDNVQSVNENKLLVAGCQGGDVSSADPLSRPPLAPSMTATGGGGDANVGSLAIQSALAAAKAASGSTGGKSRGLKGGGKGNNGGSVWTVVGDFDADTGDALCTRRTSRSDSNTPSYDPHHHNQVYAQTEPTSLQRTLYKRVVNAPAAVGLGLGIASEHIDTTGSSVYEAGKVDLTSCSGADVADLTGGDASAGVGVGVVSAVVDEALPKEYAWVSVSVEAEFIAVGKQIFYDPRSQRD